MRVAEASIEIRTPARVAIVNLSRQVEDRIRSAGVARGVALLSVPHTTCGLCVNEDEEGLRRDLEHLAGSLVDLVRPPGGFHHDRVDDNARAHLTAALLGHSVNLRIRDGAPALGTWQSVLLVEIDGPRDRRVDLVCLGN